MLLRKKFLLIYSNILYIILQAQSKGGILAKTVEYITELKMLNSRMAEQLKDTENVNMDVEMLRQQV